MNNLKVLKKALRQLSQPAADVPGDSGAPPAASPDAGPDVPFDPMARLVRQAGKAGKMGKAGKGGKGGGRLGPGGLAGVEGGAVGPKLAQKLARLARLSQEGGTAAPGEGAGRGAGKRPGGRAGKGAAGMLLAAAALGTTHLADAGPRAVFVPATPLGGVAEETVVYKQTTKGPLEMHVFLPTAPPPAGGRPCMVFFHGGSWKRGSSNQFRAFSAMLAQHGVVGMSVEYRLMEGEERQIPFDAMQDARSAMRYVRKYASRFGCDLHRIGAGGGSAGAHLAMMTAVKAPVDDPHDDLSIDPRPAALICFNGPTNFDGFEAAVPESERRKYAPYYLVDRTFPPTLIVHGTHDRVIPFAQSVAFRDKAASLGVDVRLVPFEGRGHGFFNKGKGQPGDWERSGNEMLSFLHSIGWI